MSNFSSHVFHLVFLLQFLFHKHVVYYAKLLLHFEVCDIHLAQLKKLVISNKKDFKEITQDQLFERIFALIFLCNQLSDGVRVNIYGLGSLSPFSYRRQCGSIRTFAVSRLRSLDHNWESKDIIIILCSIDSLNVNSLNKSTSL